MGADQNICKIKNYEKGMCILINTHIYIYMYRDTYSFFASGASWSSLWHQGRELFFCNQGPWSKGDLMSNPDQYTVVDELGGSLNRVIIGL